MAMPKPKSVWFRRYGGLVIGGVFISLGIGAGVIAGLSYAKYHNLANPTSRTPGQPAQHQPIAVVNKAKTTFIIWTAVASVILIIGLVVGFISISKLN